MADAIKKIFKRRDGHSEIRFTPISDEAKIALKENYISINDVDYGFFCLKDDDPDTFTPPELKGMEIDDAPALL